MAKLTEAEKEMLKAEVKLCAEKLRRAYKRSTLLLKLRSKNWKELIKWRDRHRTADKKLALDSKLTVVREGRSGKRAIDLRILLDDKVKLKELIILLEKGTEE